MGIEVFCIVRVRRAVIWKDVADAVMNISLDLIYVSLIEQINSPNRTQIVLEGE
jgi:hypothetical protein